MPDFDSRRRMMVDTQVRPSDIARYPIIEGMLQVPRELFVPDELAETAYMGEHLPLGGGRVVLDPRTTAKMLDALDPGPGDLVLDIGCGHGYIAALLARMAEAVVAVEEDEDMAREAESALASQGADSVAVIRAPLAEGAARHGPYDAIVIEGGVEQVGDAILAQLKDGGRIVALFVDGALGVVRTGYRIDGAISWRFAFNAGAPVLPGFEKAADFAF